MICFSLLTKDRHGFVFFFNLLFLFEASFISGSVFAFGLWGVSSISSLFSFVITKVCGCSTHFLAKHIFIRKPPPP